MSREEAQVLWSVYSAWAAWKGWSKREWTRKVFEALTWMRHDGSRPEHWVDAASFIFDMEGEPHAQHQRRSA